MQNSELDADQIDALVGANLKRLRLEREITVQALGVALGVTYQQVLKYEQGVNRISASTLYKASLFLHVNIGDFYEGVDILINTGSIEIHLPDPKEKSLLLFYRKIGKIDQHHVFNIVKSLSSHLDKTSTPSGGAAKDGSLADIPDKDKL
jgi:transcriptional regulator with XRE-family HTH domain